MNKKPHIAISSCVLGNCVRYNGAHKLETVIAEFFAPHVQWLPICPEVESGMSVPRPPMNIHLLQNKLELMSVTGEILTPQLQQWIERNIYHLQQTLVCGFILKSKSPSCGLEIPLYDAAGEKLMQPTTGLWAAAIKEHFSHLPVCEEIDLRDAEFRQNFLEKILHTHLNN